MTKKTAFLGVMLAIMLILTTLESVIAPLPLHVKPGLANIIVMYCALCVGRGQAFMLNVMKSFFVFITRGATAGLLSLCGGLLSIAVIILLLSVFDNGKEKKFSYSAISIVGACSHNLGQLSAAAFLMSSALIFYYLPVLIVSAVIMGLLTGALLKLLMPYTNPHLKHVWQREAPRHRRGRFDR